MLALRERSVLFLCDADTGLFGSTLDFAVETWSSGGISQGDPTGELTAGMLEACSGVSGGSSFNLLIRGGGGGDGVSSQPDIWDASLSSSMSLAT